MRFSVVPASLLAVSLVLAGATACESGDVPRRKSSLAATPDGSRDAAGFRQRNLVVTAECVLGGRFGAVEVTGWDPQTWKRLAQATFALPSSAVFSGADSSPAMTPLIDLCRQHAGSEDAVYDSDRLEWAVPRVRALFDRDFTKMAVVLHGSGGDEARVGVVDRQGGLTDLTGGEGSLGDTPHEENAVMAPDGSAVWFTYTTSAGKHRIGSRPVGGGHTLTDQGPATSTNLPLVMVGTPPRGVQADMVHVSPDGRRMAAWAHGVDQNLFDVPATSTALTAGTAEHAQTVDQCSEVVGWTGPQTLLCADETSHQFVTVGTGPDAARSAALLPANDKENEGEVISPDGRRFIFDSHRPDDPFGGFMGFYIGGTTPGTPSQKLTAEALNGQTLFLEWR
jgi:hypothetical protein